MSKLNKGLQVLVAGTCINLTIGVLYAWSVIKKALVNDWGWTNTDASMPYNVAIVVWAVALLIAGALLMVVGVVLTLLKPLAAIVLGIVLLTAGFFVGHCPVCRGRGPAGFCAFRAPFSCAAFCTGRGRGHVQRLRSCPACLCSARGATRLLPWLQRIFGLCGYCLRAAGGGLCHQVEAAGGRYGNARTLHGYLAGAAGKHPAHRRRACAPHT